MLRPLRHILLLTCIALYASGCGLKGPLYLPEERAKEAAEREQQKKDRSTQPPGSTVPAPVVPTDSPAPTASPATPPEN